MCKSIGWIMVFMIPLFHTNAQTVDGQVVDTNQQPLIGATILELNTSNGVTSDVNGAFSISISSPGSRLVMAFSGFISDTVWADTSNLLHIILYESTDELDEVVIRASPTFIDNLDPKHTEVISEAELLKAACCNLSESFETNASVDVSYTDAISGAKTIRMLGLEGRYVQINREGVPNVRGLLGRYGLSYLPGTWIQSIDVGKGAGSVVYGFESMVGQLNVELKKPENSEKLYLNGYVNSFGRMELNANHAQNLSDRWSTALLLHTNYFNNTLDQNNDGFMDIPKGRQINVMNRYKYMGEQVMSQLGWTVMHDERAGGQAGFGFGDDFRTSSEYGFQNQTTRVEVFGKTGLLFPHKPYKGWGFIYSASYLDIYGGFGRDNYRGTQQTLYGNVIFQNILGSSFHQYKVGTSLLYDHVDEVYADSAFQRAEVIPGWYAEYTFSPHDRFTLLLGARADAHNLYGTYFTPRLHTRYQLNNQTTIRLAIGKGYRTPNAIMENTPALISSRQLIVEEDPKPEISWNVGSSIVTDVPIHDRKLTLTADYFYTTFENQLIADMETSSRQLRLYNLRGKSFAHSFQLEASYSLSDRIHIKSAYKYYDVRTTINDKLQQVPFNARDRFFINASYATRFDKWVVDYTLHWYGTKRLPNTQDKPLELRRDNGSPAYVHMNAQISRGFRWGNVYVGSENLLGFTQEDPIIEAENPFFGDDFDTSIVWGPITGRMIYAGVRYKIKQ